ncbi:MAG: hypothetical protein Q9172_001106 [Xanthocarpia lactea]
MSHHNDNLGHAESNAAEKPYTMEHDDRWTAVDAYQFPHLNPQSRPYRAAIDHALSNSIEKGLKDISVAPSQGKFLSLQCQIIDAKRILEIGTLGAYSTIWMASSNPEVRVVTLEIDPNTAEIARENIRFAGLEDRIEVLVGAALDLLPRLAGEIEQGKRDRFDFSFIDADKANALPYFDWAVKMTRPRGLVYVDNMVRKGLLADEQLAKTDQNVRGVRNAVEGIGKDTRVDAVLLQTVGVKNYDGFLMALVK